MLEKLRDGCIAVTGQDFPVFLFPPGSYNEEDILCGSTHRPLLLSVCSSSLHFVMLTSAQTWRHIFQGPKLALKQTHGGPAAKAGQAKLHKMEKVTPPSITYAALHICRSCS